MTTERTSKIGRKVALTSFIFGSTLLAIFFFHPNVLFALIGSYYLILAIIVNIIVFLMVLFKYTFEKNKKSKKALIATILMMLLNIPVATLYIKLAEFIESTLRVTFQNTYDEMVTNIKITGCENKEIEKILPDCSKTVWIKIVNDCGVNVDYKVHGITKTEVVSYYGGSGRSFTHKLGIDTNSKN